MASSSCSGAVTFTQCLKRCDLLRAWRVLAAEQMVYQWLQVWEGQWLLLTQLLNVQSRDIVPHKYLLVPVAWKNPVGFGALVLA